MSEKIISIKSGKVITKDDKDWVELTDGEGKVHRVFRSIQNNEGVWVHLDEQVDMLKGKIEDGSIEGLALKLIKEQKGTFWNVIGVELVKDEFIKKAQQKVEDKTAIEKRKGISLSYSKDLAIADKIKVNSILAYAEVFDRYTKGDITVKDEQIFKGLIGKYFMEEGEQTE